ncbi:D-amino-acid oxidase [Bombyx mori]|uniref:FAD dependent oxidoreductase domain-containing protein n=1 Tax=Bombyx mori TaxID=7091 RepID=A0A8R2AM48_BOMMO|nr:D-amino-acid oxidase [Bombyx mori]
MLQIAVVGAGINGLTCALRIQEKYKKYRVVLLAKQFTPNTTGDGSAGLWYPFETGNTSSELLCKWGTATYEFLHGLWLEGGLDVCAVPLSFVYRKPRNENKPDWGKHTFGYRQIGEKHLEYLSKRHSQKFVSGHTFTTLIVPPTKLMAHFHKLFEEAGGRTLQVEVSSLEDPILGEYDVVVNCTGIGARDLVPDNSVFSVKGQVTKVFAPWVNECIVDIDGGNYIIPNPEICVLGGVTEHGNYSTDVDEDTSAFILNGCKKMLPALQNVVVVNEWAGLRPGRDQVRLEAEERGGKLYLHNYGHGGSGFTLFWGCSTDVLFLLENYLEKKGIIKKSKL